MTENPAAAPVAQAVEQAAKKASGFITRMFENAFHAWTWDRVTGVARPKTDGQREDSDVGAGKLMKSTQLNQLALTAFTNLFLRQFPALGHILIEVYDRFTGKDSVVFSISLWTAMFVRASLNKKNADKKWLVPMVENDGTTIKDAAGKDIDGPNIELSENYEWFLEQIRQIVAEAADADPDIWRNNVLDRFKHFGIISDSFGDTIARALNPRHILGNIRRWTAPFVADLRTTTAEIAQGAASARQWATTFRQNRGRIF